MRPVHATLPAGFTYFASGASALGDVRGFARIGHPIGISLPELGVDALAALLSAAVHRPLLKLFVDSGAFSEVEAGPDGRMVVVEPITAEAWRRRLDVGLELCFAFGKRALLVAPDRVGDQIETLARLRAYAADLRSAAAAGASIVVPIQRGAMTPADFDRAAAEAIGFDDFTRGIPGNKVAMPPVELAVFLRAVRPAAVHLLGVGMRSPHLPDLLEVLHRRVPAAVLSSDSNPIAALVGRTNGPGYALPRPPGDSKRRALTAWQDETGLREDAIVMTFGPATCSG